MAIEENLSRNLGQVAQEIDFAERFGESLKSLTQVLGVMRTIPMSVGESINTYTSTVTLQNGDIDPGEIIPLSEVKMEKADTYTLDYDKHRKAVPVEDIQKYGFDKAIQRSDQKLIHELRKEFRTKLFDNLKKGTGAVKGSGLQQAISNAWAGIQVAFEDEEIQTIIFVHPNDVAKYLGRANITIQTAFGMSYVENFLNIGLAIITPQVAEGSLYATAADNLILAYAPVNSGEIARAGFEFTTDATGVIGVTKDINKQRLQAETITLSAFMLFAERIDGVIKATIEEETPVETPSV